MLIFGLGNFGKKFSDNRHNAGQLLLDFLAREEGLEWKKRKDLFCFLTQKDNLYLAKPLVFMNNSGQALIKAAAKLKVKNQDLYVAHDELDLSLGRYKITFGKSSPLHKGILSIEKYLKSKSFWRIRIGVDDRNPRNRIAGEDYVLQNFSQKEKVILKKTFAKISRLNFESDRLKRPGCC